MCYHWCWGNHSLESLHGQTGGMEMWTLPVVFSPSWERNYLQLTSRWLLTIDFRWTSGAKLDINDGQRTDAAHASALAPTINKATGTTSVSAPLLQHQASRRISCWNVGVVGGDDLSSLTALIKHPSPLAHLLSCSNCLLSYFLSPSPTYQLLLLLFPPFNPCHGERGCPRSSSLISGGPSAPSPPDHQCHGRNTHNICSSFIGPVKLGR